MTGPLTTLLLFLFPPAPISGSVYVPPDTPASDVVHIRSPYALAKDHSRGPNPPTELVGPYPRNIGCLPPPAWVYQNGEPMLTVLGDAERVALTGNWLISQDRMGRYIGFGLSEPHALRPSDSSLDDVNAQLAEHGVPPVSDADFRTFEQWAEERDRRKATQLLTGLSVISFGWLAVAGAAFWFRRRAA